MLIRSIFCSLVPSRSILWPALPAVMKHYGLAADCRVTHTPRRAIECMSVLFHLMLLLITPMGELVASQCEQPHSTQLFIIKKKKKDYKHLSVRELRGKETIQSLSVYPITQNTVPISCLVFSTSVNIHHVINRHDSSIINSSSSHYA